MTTYQLYLILLGFLTDKKSDESMKALLLELYKRADMAESEEV